MFSTRRSKVISVMIGLLIIGAIGAALFFSAESEPEYNGKGIRQWTLELNYGTPEQTDEARTAMNRIGPAAIPYLIRLLEKEDAGLDGWLGKTLRNIPYAFWSDGLASMSHAIAATALREFGPAAQSAIPAWKRWPAEEIL